MYASVYILTYIHRLESRAGLYTGLSPIHTYIHTYTHTYIQRLESRAGHYAGLSPMQAAAREELDRIEDARK